MLGTMAHNKHLTLQVRDAPVSLSSSFCLHSPENLSKLLQVTQLLNRDRDLTL